MKFLAVALILIGSGAYAQSQTPSVQSFSLNQENQTLNLEGKEFETLYRTDQVPATCYRNEVQGTKPECHTEYDHQCHTEYHQQCGYRYYPVCQTVPRNVCSSQQVCRTVNDQVCNSHGCTTVPRRECHLENHCYTQYDNVCHNESRYECQNVPQQFCQDFPRQVCVNVPNVVQVPYSCTKPVQVAIGQSLKLQTVVRVTIHFVNFPEVGAINDPFSLKLVGDQVALSVQSKDYFYQIIAQTRKEQMLSATEKLIDLDYSIQATSLKNLEAFSSVEIQNGKIGFDQIQFSLSSIPNVPFKGHLKLTQHRAIGRDLVIVDQDFSSRLLVFQSQTAALMLNALSAGPIRDKHHYVKLALSIDQEALHAGAINPEILTGFNPLPLESAFEGNPQ